MSARLLATAVLFLACGLAAGAEAPRAAKDAADAQAVAARIDRLIVARWTAAQVVPAPRADDAEFLRRVYLDVTGRIPSVEETRTFLDDRRPDKRALLVDKLLTGSRYVT